jgi:hypothetical protein
MTGKRVLACSLFGLIAGLVCWLSSQIGGEAGIVFHAPLALGTILNRAFIGFAIGVSGWRAHWALHGVVIGGLGSLPLAAGGLDAPYGYVSFIVMTAAGAVWGFLIELAARGVGAKMK